MEQQRFSTAQPLDPEQPGAVETVHQGAQYLALLDMQQYAEVPITVHGQPMLAQDFVAHPKCMEKAQPLFTALESLPSNDPRRERLKGLLATQVLGYLQSFGAMLEPKSEVES